MTPEKRREVSSLGGKALQPQQRSFSQNRELARAAGRKGGLTPKKLKQKLTPDSQLTESVANVPRETMKA